MIQGTALVAVVVGEGEGVVEVTLEVMMVVATVGVGLITLAVVEVHGALPEDLEAETLDGLVVVATITVVAVGMEAGVHLLLPLTLVVEAGEQQLLLVAPVLLMTRDGAVPRRRFQHRMAVVGGAPPAVGAGEGCVVPA